MSYKFPSYIQHDQMDCGPACLKLIAKHFGKTFSMKYLRDRCYITREGVSLFDIARAAEEIGFRTLSIKINFEDIRTKIPFPVIVHWKQKHFVVVYRISRNRVYVSDPAIGLVTYSHQSFKDAWEVDSENGSVLVTETTPDFFNQNENETSDSFSPFLKYLTPYRGYLSQVVIGMIAGLLIGLLTPFINQSIVDFGIGSGNMKFINSMLLAGLVLAISTMISGFIQNRLMLYISERINMGMISDFLRKTLTLPVPFFERKLTTDILTRIGDHDRIQSFIMSTVLGIFINILLLLVYSTLMFYYEVNMFIVFMLGNLLYIIWISLFLRKRKILDNVLFEYRSGNANDLLELLENIGEIKINNIGSQRRWKWEYSRYKIYSLSVKNMNINQLEVTGATFIIRIQGIFITYIAASNVINGTMTLGMMMAAQYILGQLSGPIHNMIGYIHSYQFAKLSLKRVNEIILDEQPEKSNGKNPVPHSKSIVFKNLDFKYNPNFSKVLDNINLVVPEGKVTAIVGESGSGKSSLIKLLLRFYEPSSGNIEIGGISLDSIELDRWRAKCGVVMQGGSFFNDTILYNITLEDENINHKRLFEAIAIANISELINERHLKIYTPIGTNGSGLSQGEKQRILIARAIYKDPDFIFLDEATNSLDANNENEITNNLNTILEGKTAIVIAHRLSTIKNAHNIVVLHKGSIVEQGTHDELISNEGFYFKLVQNQLSHTEV